jgi:predicted trehalose synthase
MKHEGAGNASTLFGHSQNGGRFDGVDVSKMTLAQVKEFSRPDGEYGQWVKQQLAASGQKARVATPMGYGQIVGTTLRNTAQALGLSDDTIFDAATQTKMVDYLATQRIKSASTAEGRRAGMRAEWEGFKNVPDNVLDQTINEFIRNGYSSQPRQQANQNGYAKTFSNYSMGTY